MLQQMLDLDRHVVGDAGKLTRQACDDALGVADAVEEVGIAEGDVPRAGGNLRAHVGEHDVGVRRCGSGRRRPEQSGSAGTGACSRGWPPCSRRSVVRPGSCSVAYRDSGGRPVARRHAETAARGIDACRAAARRGDRPTAASTRSLLRTRRRARDRRRAREADAHSAARTTRTPSARVRIQRDERDR